METLADGNTYSIAIQLTANGTFGVSAKDGKKLWYYDRFNGNTANVPTPIVKGNQVFIAAGYGGGNGVQEHRTW